MVAQQPISSTSNRTQAGHPDDSGRRRIAIQRSLAGLAVGLRHGVMGAQISTPQAGMASCIRCGERWEGLRTAHCDACHQTFTVPAGQSTHLKAAG
jgi:hypothetical protein